MDFPDWHSDRLHQYCAWEMRLDIFLPLAPHQRRCESCVRRPWPWLTSGDCYTESSATSSFPSQGLAVSTTSRTSYSKPTFHSVTSPFQTLGGSICHRIKDTAHGPSVGGPSPPRASLARPPPHLSPWFPLRKSHAVLRFKTVCSGCSLRGMMPLPTHAPVLRVWLLTL